MYNSVSHLMLGCLFHPLDLAAHKMSCVEDLVFFSCRVPEEKKGGKVLAGQR